MAKDKNASGSGIMKALTGLFSQKPEQVETPEDRRRRHAREAAATRGRAQGAAATKAQLADRAQEVLSAAQGPAEDSALPGPALEEISVPQEALTPFSGQEEFPEIDVPDPKPATGSGWARPVLPAEAAPDFTNEIPDARASLPPSDPEPALQQVPDLAPQDDGAAPSGNSDFWKRPGVKMGVDFSSESHAEYLQSLGELLQTLINRSSGSRRKPQPGEAAQDAAPEDTSNAHYCVEFSYPRLVARVWIHNGAIVAADYGSAMGDRASSDCPVGLDALAAIAQNPARAARVRAQAPLEAGLDVLAMLHGGPYGIMAASNVIAQAACGIDQDGRESATAARKKHESGIFTMSVADAVRRVSSGRGQAGLAYFREFQEGEPCTYAHFRVKQPDGSLKSEWCIAVQDAEGMPVPKPGLPTYHFILGQLGREFIVQRSEGERYCFVTVEGKVTRSGVPMHKVRELLDAPDSGGVYVYDGVNESLIKALRDAFQGKEGFPSALVPGRNLSVDFAQATPYGYVVARVRADAGLVRLVVDVHGRLAQAGEFDGAAEVEQDGGFLHVRGPDGRYRFLTDRGELSKTAYGSVVRAGARPLWVLSDPVVSPDGDGEAAEESDLFSGRPKAAGGLFADAPEKRSRPSSLVINARLQTFQLDGDDALAVRETVGFWDSENLSDELRALRESILTILLP